MKKLLSILTVFMCSICMTWAGDTFTLTLSGSAVQDPSDSNFFTVVSGGGFNSKYKGTYNGESYTNGLKINSKSNITFTTQAASTITIVQSLSANSGNVPGLNGNALTGRVDDADNTVGVFTLTDAEAGTYTIASSGGTGETGLLYVKVEYTGTVLAKLDAPAITVDTSTGEVTIGAVANASKITYTIDGTIPTAESTEYEAPFTVEDGVTVNAIAIGDLETYSNSDVASQQVLLDNVTVAAPVISQYNGTVAIACETPAVTIEYSLDGTNYQSYVRAFTLSEDGTVYARAIRGTNTSEVANTAVTTISKGTATKTIWMGHGSFDDNTANSMTGKSGDDAEGFTLTITGNSEKKWSSGSVTISVEGTERTAIKLSNGAQNTLTFPEGLKATRITFYSVINSASGARTSYWKEFNGTSISSDVPMGAWNDVSDRLTNPDVRVFPLNGDETSITFTNTGEQLLFVIAVDVEEGEATGIQNIEAVELDNNIYNLQGVRVEKTQKGLYIMNGKKVLVK